MWRKNRSPIVDSGAWMTCFSRRWIVRVFARDCNGSFLMHVSTSPPVFFRVIAIFSYSTESRRWKTCKFDRRVLLLNSQRALHTVWLLEWIPILQYLRMSFHFAFDRQTSNHFFFAPNLPTRQRWWSHLATSRQRNLRKYKKKRKSDSPRYFRVLIEIINHIWSNSNLFARKHSGEEDEEEKKKYKNFLAQPWMMAGCYRPSSIIVLRSQRATRARTIEVHDVAAAAAVSRAFQTFLEF